jgi:LysM repeat protein
VAAHRWRAPLARYGAPAAFLAAATVAALLVRAGLKAGDRPARTPSTAATATPTATSASPAYYRIRSGDTLGAVAARFHTTVDELLTLNPRVDPNSLYIGQRLRVR